MLHVLDPESSRQSRRVLKLLKRVRTTAGRVRDMDVLISKASGLSCDGPSEGITRLIEHLSAIRNRDTRRLYRTVKHYRKKVRSTLKHFLRCLDRLSSENPSLSAVSSAPPAILTARLLHWPKLHEENLHEFRKAVKELRYMLQLAAQQNAYHMNALARVKDTGGEWHDWLQMEDIAEAVLDPIRDAAILSKLGDVLQEKLRTALSAANQLRKQGIELQIAA